MDINKFAETTGMNKGCVWQMGIHSYASHEKKKDTDGKRATSDQRYQKNSSDIKKDLSLQIKWFIEFQE